MPPDSEPYHLRIWQKVHSAEELQHEDAVRIIGMPSMIFSARVRPKDLGGYSFRLREVEDNILGENTFYNRAVEIMAEAGLLERRLNAQIRKYDVWANQWHVYSFRGGLGWRDLLDITNEVQLSEAQLPDDLYLVWRRSDEPEPSGSDLIEEI